MKNKSHVVLAITFICFTLLSWILLLRDLRALFIIHNFYPQMGDFLIKQRDFLMVKGLNSWPTFLFAMIILGGFYSYLSSLTGQLTLKKVAVFSLIFQIIVFFSYPILSTDIFYYILSDRVATVYHQNVWTTSTSNFPEDPFFHLTDWRMQTKIYGPVNQFFYNFASAIGGSDLLMSVVTHKLIVIFFVLVSLLAIIKIWPKVDPKLLAVIFWNPLFVIETASSGHNDVLMLFFAIISVMLFSASRFLSAAVFLALAIHVKIMPLLLFLFFVGKLLHERKFFHLMVFFLALLVTASLLFLTMKVDLFSFVERTLYSTSLFWQSLPTVFRAYLPSVQAAWQIGFALIVIIQIYRLIIRKGDYLQLFLETLLIYLVFFVKSYWNWYALWLLPFVVFLQKRQLVYPIVALTLSSALAYPLLWLSQRFNYEHPIWSVIIYLLIASMPVGAYFYARNIKKIQ